MRRITSPSNGATLMTCNRSPMRLRFFSEMDTVSVTTNWLISLLLIRLAAGLERMGWVAAAISFSAPA